MKQFGIAKPQIAGRPKRGLTRMAFGSAECFLRMRVLLPCASTAGTGEKPGAIIPHAVVRGLSGNWQSYRDGGFAEKNKISKTLSCAILKI